MCRPFEVRINLRPEEVRGDTVNVGFVASIRQGGPEVLHEELVIHLLRELVLLLEFLLKSIHIHQVHLALILPLQLLFIIIVDILFLHFFLV